MASRRLFAALVGLLVGWGLSRSLADDNLPEKPQPGAANPSGDADDDQPKAEPVDPEMLRLFLMDGSVITGKLSVKTIEVQTAFGRLTVPITELRSFTPGLESHAELAKTIYDLIDKLGSNEFPEREQAQKALLRMGVPVRGELEKRTSDPDTERRTRIRSILEEIAELNSDEAAEDPSSEQEVLIERDRVETTHFTAVGKIAAETLTITSKYGPLSVRLSDIRRGQRDATKKADVRKVVMIDGGNIVQRGLKSTAIKVERGDRVTVTAEGNLTMTPWGNGMFSSPDGGPNFGWYIPNSIPSGALIAAIGGDENIFKVGSKSTFRAERTGILRLGVAMQADYAAQSFPGRYTVRIRVERK